MRLSSFARMILAVAALVAATPSRGESLFLGTQLHARTGTLNATYQGASELVSGDIQVAPTLDFDFEAFTTPSRSYFLRANLSHDMSQNRMPYAYIGTGTRYYFNRAGIPIDRMDANTRVVLLPRSRFFIGADVGVAQVVTRVFNEALSSQATMLEFGAHGGWIYQLGEKLGLEVVAGYSIGLGFSTVSANGSILRALIGVSYLY